MNPPITHDVHSTIGENVDGLFIHKKQEVPDDFLKHLEQRRLESAAARAGELHEVCSVPVFCYEMWMRRGEDPYRWTARQLLARLRKDNLEAFISTTKAI